MRVVWGTIRKEHLKVLEISNQLSGDWIIIPETREMFACEMVATKAVSIAQERIQALEHMGFCLSEEALIGHDGTKYNSYYVREV